MSGSPLTDLILNVASGCVIVFVILQRSRPDLTRLILTGYAVVFLLSVAVPRGGQANAGLATGAALYSLVEMFAPDKAIVLDDMTFRRVSTPIFSGVLTLSRAIPGASSANACNENNHRYNSYDPSSEKYRYMPASSNRDGGTQFTYTLWISTDKEAPPRREDLYKDGKGTTLFLRGDCREYPLYRKHPVTEEIEDLQSRPVVMCPRVSLLSASELVVEVNTDTVVREKFSITFNSPNEVIRNNIMSIIPGKYALLTFVFRDSVDFSGFEKGTKLTVFFNKTKYYERSVPGSLRTNEGMLHVAPESAPGIRIADLTYHNWAMGATDVAAVFNAGFDDSYVDSSKKGDKLEITPYNSLDIYNYDLGSAFS
jgi:hypothetical protein